MKEERAGTVPMRKGDVKSFSDLVEFAAQRAKRSARRGDPVAWAYWKDTLAWARHAVANGLCPPESWGNYALDYAEVASNWREKDPGRAARLYSKAKWFRIMAVNSGRKDVKPLSLKWLKDNEAR